MLTIARIWMMPWRVFAYFYGPVPVPPKPNLCQRCETKIPVEFDPEARRWHCERCVADEFIDRHW